METVVIQEVSKCEGVVDVAKPSLMFKVWRLQGFHKWVNYYREQLGWICQKFIDEASIIFQDRHQNKGLNLKATFLTSLEV